VKPAPATGGNARDTASIAYPFPLQHGTDPFPLQHGTVASLHLPRGGLDPRDADRLIEFIRALTIPERMDRP